MMIGKLNFLQVIICIFLCGFLGNGYVLTNEDNNSTLTIEVGNVTSNEASYDNGDYYHGDNYTDEYNNTYDDYEVSRDGDEDESEEMDSNPQASPYDEPDDDNCMRVESHLMTEEMINCCTLLNSSMAVLSNTSRDLVERCGVLQLLHRWGVSSVADVEGGEDGVMARKVYNERCFVKESHQLKRLLCCLSGAQCALLKHGVLKTMCRRCSHVCPKCGGVHLH